MQVLKQATRTFGFIKFGGWTRELETWDICSDQEQESCDDAFLPCSRNRSRPTDRKSWSLSGYRQSAVALGFQTDELHVEGEGGVGWNDTWMPFTAVGIVWWADQLGSLANTHLSYSFFPATDDLLVSDLKSKRLSPRPRRVENLSVCQGACGRKPRKREK